MEDQTHLTRRQRRALQREAKREGVKTSGIFKKLIIIGIVVLVIAGIGYWLFNEGSKPLPGEAAPELGRDHVDDIAGVEYSSNPPTSGTHFPMWAKKGVYDRLISDGYLIHSMEHGYVIMWYDCGKLATTSLIPEALAQEPTPEPASAQPLTHMNLTPSAEMSAFTPENQPDVEVELPEEFKSDSCKEVQTQLASLVGFRDRVIVAPRIGMTSPIAVTAWGRMLKLDAFDKTKIEEFISAFHNKGPEKTVE